MERKFFCFLIVDELNQHDQKNQQRVQGFVNYHLFRLNEESSSAKSLAHDSGISQSSDRKKKSDHSGRQKKSSHTGRHHSTKHSSYLSRHESGNAHHCSSHSSHYSSDHMSRSHYSNSKHEQKMNGFVIKELDSFIGRSTSLQAPSSPRRLSPWQAPSTCHTSTSHTADRFISDDQLLSDLNDSSQEPMMDYSSSGMVSSNASSCSTNRQVASSPAYHDSAHHSISASHNNSTYYSDSAYDVALATDRSSVLDELKKRIQRQKDELNVYLRKVEQSTHCSDLVHSLIAEQMTLSLKEREQNYQTKEQNLSFTRTVKLATSDLNVLLDKNRIPFGYTVENAEINLNLIMKDS